MKYSFSPSGVCSQKMTVELDGDGKIKSLDVSGGCSGNLQGFCKKCSVFSRQSLLEPIFAVHKPGDNVADHIVPSGVDHGGRGIHQIADDNQDGESHLPAAYASKTGRTVIQFARKYRSPKIYLYIPSLPTRTAYSPMSPPPGTPLMPTEDRTATSTMGISRSKPISWPKTPRTKAIFSTQLKQPPTVPRSPRPMPGP